MRKLFTTPKKLEGQDLFSGTSLKTCAAWVTLRVSRLQKVGTRKVLLQRAKYALEKNWDYIEKRVSVTQDRERSLLQPSILFK